MECELIRTKRKTIAIYIREGRVVVRAPLRAPLRDIDRFVISKTGWIEKHLAVQIEHKDLHKDLILDNESIVMLLGREYPIESILTIKPGLSHERLNKMLVAFYKEKAKEYIPERVAFFKDIIKAHPTDIRIGSAKRSWGSCTSAGRLSFSWRLMTAPPADIDYVVLHELAHLIQFNHSPKFRAIISSVIPDWKDRRKSLRALQSRLHF